MSLLDKIEARQKGYVASERARIEKIRRQKRRRSRRAKDRMLADKSHHASKKAEVSSNRYEFGPMGVTSNASLHQKSSPCSDT